MPDWKKIDPRKLYTIIIFAVSFLILLSFLMQIKDFFVNYLWYQSLGYLRRFLVVFTIQVRIFFSFLLLSGIVIAGNYIWLKNNLDNSVKKGKLNAVLFNNFFLSSFYFILLVIFSIWPMQWWEHFLRYINSINFNLTDPLFNNDISFYVFRLPLLKLIRIWFLLLALILTIHNIVYYYFAGIITYKNIRFFIPRHVRWHLGILFSILSVLLGFGFYFAKFQFLLKQGLTVKGAAYLDIYSFLAANNIFLILFFLMSLFFIYWIFRPDNNYLLLLCSLLFLSYIIFNGIVPFTIQQIIVKPNEFEKEKPYISSTIKYTRMAYKIDKVKKIDFRVKNNLTIKNLNQDIIDNISIWDLRFLKSTLRQLQEIRPYYIFSDIDIDRYRIGGKLQQVMLAVREMTHNNLAREARNWINRYLKYTHGYGLVMMPVNSKTAIGKPEFFIKDIPPYSNIEMKVHRPEIYYGTTMSDYVLVKTKTKEFDYPSGEGNMYNYYQGSGGIKVDTFWKRLLMSVYLNDYKLLFSSLITDKSRVMIRRNVIEIARNLVPFLMLDNDPYSVVIDGQVYWYLDAYTYTDKFPYSEIFAGNFNYIRNSVKIIINAYTGKVMINVVDEEDPIIKVYCRAFPKLFKSVKDLPEKFKEHFRYPSDLFMIQSEIYRTYHMTDPEVFFNREDIWDISSEMYDENQLIIRSYYVLNKIKGNTETEFLNVLPFTPAKEDSMIGLLMGRCDQKNYGDLVVYNFSKKRPVYGPMQVESFINQNPNISTLMTLWSQKDAHVVRGHIVVIPIEDSLIYIEPLFIYSDTREVPELKKIIAFYNENVAIGDTIHDALEQVITGKIAYNDNDLIINQACSLIDDWMKEADTKDIRRMLRIRELIKQIK